MSSWQRWVLADIMQLAVDLMGRHSQDWQKAAANQTIKRKLGMLAVCRQVLQRSPSSVDKPAPLPPVQSPQQKRRGAKCVM